MEVDGLKEALNLLKKDPSINITKLKNHEKGEPVNPMHIRESGFLKDA